MSAEAGKLGEPVYLPSSEDKRAKRLWHINKFNIVVSDKIPLNRSLPDVRKPNCQSKEYDSDLPHVSELRKNIATQIKRAENRKLF